jgi:hypothetical protein
MGVSRSQAAPGAMFTYLRVHPRPGVCRAPAVPSVHGPVAFLSGEHGYRGSVTDKPYTNPPDLQFGKGASEKEELLD